MPNDASRQGRHAGRAVIFDMDGVLLRTDEYHFRSWLELSQAHGVAFDRATFDARLRGLERRSALVIFLERAGRVFGEDEQVRLAAEKQERFLEIVAREGVEPLAGVVELIADLRRVGAKIGVGSSSRNTQRLLSAARLLERVDAVVDANTQRGKPAPDIFLAVARQLGVEPGRCVVIEDALDGIEAARRAGMAVLAVGDHDRLGHMPHHVPTLEGVAADWLLSLAGE